MKINVTENKVSIKEEQILNENEYNIHKIQFDFSSEYTDDLVKVALFSIDNHTYKKIISNNECDIPPEVLTQRGYSILGVYAYKTEQDTLVLRYSPSPTKISVYDGSYKADAENSEPITPSEIEQYQQILQNSLQQFQNQYNALVEETEGDIQAIEDELQRKVDEGYFDGEDGFSPIAKVIQKSNGATIEIEDKNGKTTADVLNGEDGYTPVRGVDYWTEEDKQEVKEEATQQIEGKIEEYNENAAEKLNQYNQNSVQKTNDYNTNATEKTSTYNSNAETKKTAYDENATQKTNSFNTNATNKLTEYNTNHTEKMSTYNNNSTEKLNAFNENAVQKTEDFDEHTEEIQDNIEILQRTDNQILSRFNKDEEVSGQDIILTETTEIKFAKPPLPMGNSEQVQYSGKNLLNISQLDETVQGIRFKGNDNNELTISGTYTGSANYISFPYKAINLPAGTYTFTSDSNNTPSGITLRLWTTPTNLNLLNGGSGTTQEDLTSFTFSLIGISNGGTYNITYKIQLENGNTKTDFEPYVGGTASPNPDYPQTITNVTGDVEVVVGNKNLFDEENATVLYSNTRSTIQSITNGIRVTAGQTSSSAFVTTKICNVSDLIDNKITVKAYWQGTNNGRIEVGYCDANGLNRVTLAPIGISGNSISVTVPEGIQDKVIIVWFYARGNANGYVDYTNIQLEYGSTATDYVEHKEQVFTFPLGNEKLMLGDYLADDGIHHLRGQYIFTGSETWNFYSASAAKFGIILPNVKNEGQSINPSFLCTQYRSLSWDALGNNSPNNLIAITSANMIRFRNTSIDTLENWTQYITEQYNNGTPVIIEYPLNEEVIVPYTSAQQEVYNQIKNAYSYDEMTIITGSSDGNKPFFTVQAYKDLNKELNNKVDKVQGKELSSNDFTDTLKEKLEGLENYDDTEIKADISDIQEEQTEQNTDIENLQEENARLKATLPTTTGEGQDVTLNKTAEFEFKKPPLPRGNSEQEGEPSPDNEVPITNVTGNVEVTISNENNTESKTLPVSLGNIELCKIGNYQDYIYKNEGNWYVHKNIIKIDLSTITSYTRTSGWRNPTAFVADNVFNHEYSGYTAVASLFCNRLIADTPARITGSVINAIGLGRNSSMYMSVEGITTSNALITYFSQNPTYLYAPLATPTDTEITDTTLISQLEEISKTLSYQGQTNITSNTIALFDVEAYQSTKLVLEEMATAIVALGGV